MSTSVLVVEDNPVNQRIAQRMLERLGCTVDLADNGQAALLMAGSRQYDLIFMDCSMPGMDGFDTTVELRRAHAGKARVPIVALTGHSSEQDRERCLQAGMDDYLTKPVAPACFKAALDLWTKAGAS